MKQVDKDQIFTVGGLCSWIYPVIAIIYDSKNEGQILKISFL